MNNLEIGQEHIVVLYGTSSWHIPKFKKVTIHRVSPTGWAKATDEFGEEFTLKHSQWGDVLHVTGPQKSFRRNEWRITSQENWDAYNRKAIEDRAWSNLATDLLELSKRAQGMSKETLIENLEEIMTSAHNL